MSENLFQTAVAEILERHDADVTDDPVRLRNLLRDYCTSEQCRREINVTVMCAKNGLLASIREPDDRTPPEARRNRFVTILQDDYGIDLSLARHVVGTWMESFTYSRNHVALDLGGGVKLELVWCPPGTFTMGSPESEDGRRYEETQHEVTLTKGFWMGKSPVTQAQWKSVMGNNPSYSEDAGKDAPVEWVSWDDCQSFIHKLNAQVPCGGFHLPTEAEWEYAARGGPLSRGYVYSGGNDLNEVGWYGNNSCDATHPVGQKRANELGLCDMSGNIWEWCQDWYGGYPSRGVTDPAGAVSGSNRVLRGGSWYGSAQYCRSANRGNIYPSSQDIDIGFRLVRTIENNTAESRLHADVTLTGMADIGTKSVSRAVPPQITVQTKTEPKPLKPSSSPVPPARPAGETSTVDLARGVKLELVWCPPGTFTMGRPASEKGHFDYDEETQHEVTLTKGFWMGKYPVMQAQWESVMGNNPSYFKHVGKDAPAENVSWNDCQSFIQKLNARIPSGGFRLPTEAEWEYTARGGPLSQGYLYSGGNDLNEVGWYGGNSEATTHPVGKKRANELGLYDMSGNVWEWCQDWYGSYPSGGVTDPAGAVSGSYRVLRGGGWRIFARYCRSTFRSYVNPYCQHNYFGFRAARTLP